MLLEGVIGAVLLLSWLQPRLGCETGVAHVQSVLSVPRSLLANADVALLKNYHSDTLARCMEECCSGTYGSCSVASFKRNSTKENCMHFYCRPLNKCKFLSSNSTDSFSFSSELKKKTKNATTTSTTKDGIATYSEEQFAIKNDNTTVKPRKGVEEDSPLEDLHSKSGVKPRKGVSTQDVPHSELLPTSLNKSNVKARKGVTNPTEVPNSSATAETATQKLAPHPVEDINTNDLISELQKVFEDDTQMTSVASTSTSDWKTSVGISPTLSSTQSAYTTNYEGSSGLPTKLLPSYTTQSSQLISSSRTKTLMDHSTVARQFVSAAVEEIIVPFSSSQATVIYPSTTMIHSSKVPTPSLGEDFHQELSHPSKMGESVQQELGQLSSREEKVHLKVGQSLLEKELNQELKKLSSLRGGSHEKLVSSNEDNETENERRYKSSIHLVLALVFGLLVLFAVLGVVAKRVYDGWQRRDYYRMNYLIDGIYNGVD